MNIALLLLLATYAYGASLPEGVTINPCVDSELYYLRYYQPYPVDERKYIECSPWGDMCVLDCYKNARWNAWLGRCADDVLANSFNSSSNVSSTDVPFLPPVDLNMTSCSYYGNTTCVNGGICNMYPTGGRCGCLSNYSGEYCQTYNESSWGVFGLLINDSFSLDVYRKNRPLLDEFYVFNGTIDTSVIKDNETRERIAEYVALYPNSTMRFDMLVNYLIQDYLSLLYPWQFFLQEFGYQSEALMGYVNSIPGLLLSSKYSYDQFEHLWNLYDDVLRRLVDYLPKFIPTIRKEALLFYQIYDAVFREFQRSGNFSVMLDDEFANRSRVTVDMIREKLRRDFNQTLLYSYRLFHSLGRFDEQMAVLASTGAPLNATYIQELIANYSSSDNVTMLIGQLSDKNAEIWDSLSFYGFWYVISAYVPEDLLNSTRNESYFLNGSAVARVLRPNQRPSGVFRLGATQKPQNVPVFQALVSDDPNVGEQPEEQPVSDRLVVDEVLNRTVTDKLFNETVAVSDKLVSGDLLNRTVVEKLSNDTVFHTEKLSNGTLVAKRSNTTVVVSDKVVADVENRTFVDKWSNGTVVEAKKVVSDDLFNLTRVGKWSNGTEVEAKKVVSAVDDVVPVTDKLTNGTFVVAKKVVSDVEDVVPVTDKLTNGTVVEAKKFVFDESNDSVGPMS